MTREELFNIVATNVKCKTAVKVRALICTAVFFEVIRGVISWLYKVGWAVRLWVTLNSYLWFYKTSAFTYDLFKHNV